MRALFIGDVFGRPGRVAVHRLLAQLKEEYRPDLVIANAENATHGTGMSTAAYEELTAAGIDVFTGGNHTFGRPEVIDLMSAHRSILCPGNFGTVAMQHGYIVWESSEGPVAIVNIMGQYCMNGADNPFRYAEDILARPEIKSVRMRILDFHAEATAEKATMLHLLDGRVSAVIGTHTHVPTADAHVTTQGTAFITDVGMTGVRSSIIGLDAEVMMRRYTTGILYPPRVAEGVATLMAVIVDIDATSGHSMGIELLQREA